MWVASDEACIEKRAGRVGAESVKFVGRPLAYALIFVVGATPLVLTPVIPTVDFYNHIARYFVLAHVSSDGFLAQNYAANWSLLPNVGLDILATGLMRHAPAEIVAKAIAVGMFAIQYTGLLFFGRQLTGRTTVFAALASIPLLYSYIFTWGFANFLFGVGLVFWGAGWWLKARARPAVAAPVASLLAVVIFLTHGFAFAVYGVLLFGLEVGLWLTGRNDLRAFATRTCLLLAQALVPAALFMVSSTSKSPNGLTDTDENIKRLHEGGRLMERVFAELSHRIETIVRVAEGPTFWFDAVTFTLALALLAIMLSNRRARIVPVAWPALGLFALITIAIPPHLFGVGYVSDRIPLLLSMVGIASLTVDASEERWTSPLLLALIALVTVRVVYIGIDWHAYRSDYDAFERTAARIPQGHLVKMVSVAQVRRHAPGARCEMYGPLLAASHGEATPLFANATQQPLKLKGRLKAAAAALPTGIGVEPDDLAHSSRLLAAAVANFDYVVVCDAHRLQSPPPGRVLARDGRFTLIQR